MVERLIPIQIPTLYSFNKGIPSSGILYLIYRKYGAIEYMAATVILINSFAAFK